MINCVIRLNMPNKFKGLYLLAHRRTENAFSLNTPLNNPMNITIKGDLGIKTLDTHETVDGVYQATTNNFEQFSTEEIGFDAYIGLLGRGFREAHQSLFDENK